MQKRLIVVCSVIAVVVTFLFLPGLCSEKSNETGKDVVAETGGRGGTETTEEELKKITNSIGMEFVYISPTGAEGFLMGSPETERDREVDERQHKVILTGGFYLQTTELSQKQWKAVMGDNPSLFKGDDLPVERVTWEQAQEFIRKLNEKEGTDRYRLPTEAEWEYSCRAGTRTIRWWGKGVDVEACWFSYNSKWKTHPVGKTKPNPWGLHDMYGNVWEWCRDWYDYDYYEKSPEKDPQGSESGKYRVLRGISVAYYSTNCRSAYRYKGLPDYPLDFVGFRVLREAD